MFLTCLVQRFLYFLALCIRDLFVMCVLRPLVTAISNISERYVNWSNLSSVQIFIYITSKMSVAGLYSPRVLLLGFCFILHGIRASKLPSVSPGASLEYTDKMNIPETSIYQIFGNISIWCYCSIIFTRMAATFFFHCIAPRMFQEDISSEFAEQKVSIIDTTKM